VENIAGYVYDHTTCDERRWHELDAVQRGPYFVSATYQPQRDRFLELIQLYSEQRPDCDPLDGHEHNLAEMTRWIGIRELALRLIGLGVMLGVFELVRPWEERAEESREKMIGRLDRGDEGSFRLKVRRRSGNAIGVFPGVLASEETAGPHSGVGIMCPQCGATCPVS
jgi:hypothetical protein